ncbi:SCP-2 sterol transfer family protein [Lachnospiraceae bacterium XBB1006]|nr:SCP-2 sterol transfer family protein [Lachnospiraceae bacterium XBB1006]
MTYRELVKELKNEYQKIDASAVEQHFAIQFNIEGEAEGAFYVEFEAGKIDVQPYEYYDRNVIFTTDYQTSLDMASGKTKLLDAYKNDKLGVWGDLDQAIAVYESLKPMQKKTTKKTTAKKTTTKKKTTAKKQAVAAK